MGVAYLWAGGATTTSLRAVVALDAPASSVRAAFSTDAAFTSPIWSAPVTPDADNVCPVEVAGLTGDTRYYWTAEIDGALQTGDTAQARTLPADPATVSVTFGSCWSQYLATGVTIDHPVGAAVAAQHDAGANLHLFIGDFGYANIAAADPDAYRGQYAAMHAIANLAAMARSAAWVHMYDDHDFGPDNSDSTSPGRDAAASVYRQVVPHYDTPDPAANYHAFTVGDLRFVVTDLRYYRSPDSDPDGVSKTMLGDTQKQWLKDEWLAAKQAGQLIVWVSTSVWCIDGADTDSGLNSDGDHWGTFTAERAELDDFRAANGITNMVILTGDSHAIGYRLGVDYSTAQTVPTPVFMAAAYSRSPAWRPAAWDQVSEAADSDGHYGLLSVSRHAGGGWDVSCDFHEVDPDTSADAVAFSASVPVGQPEPGLYAIRRDDGVLCGVRAAGGGVQVVSI